MGIIDMDHSTRRYETRELILMLSTIFNLIEKGESLACLSEEVTIEMENQAGLIAKTLSEKYLPLRPLYTPPAGKAE